MIKYIHAFDVFELWIGHLITEFSFWVFLVIWYFLVFFFSFFFFRETVVFGKRSCLLLNIDTSCKINQLVMMSLKFMEFLLNRNQTRCKIMIKYIWNNNLPDIIKLTNHPTGYMICTLCFAYVKDLNEIRDYHLGLRVSLWKPVLVSILLYDWN